MANNLKDHLKEVADAIRAKKGTSELINPQDFATEIEGISGGGSGEGGGSDTLYFATKDGGAMGWISEMALMGGFAVKKADNTISSIGTFLSAGDYTPEALSSIKAVAIALGNYSSGGGADISNPDTLRAIMFHFNGAEEMPKIIEITKEQFYDLNA